MDIEWKNVRAHRTPAQRKEHLLGVLSAHHP
jgi:hypothetical protein